MAIDKRVAKLELHDLLTAMSWHRNDLLAYRRRKKKGDTANVALCERLLKLDYALIRSYCAEHGLDLPHDVPPEDAA